MRLNKDCRGRVPAPLVYRPLLPVFPRELVSVLQELLPVLHVFLRQVSSEGVLRLGVVHQVCEGLDHWGSNGKNYLSKKNSDLGLR